jgi:anaerobic selenocysteine-containing dehydrogenase
MKRKSFCRICTALCGLEVELDGDTVVRVNGDRDSPLSEGFSCFKGRYAGELHHRDDRLLVPKMRKHGAMVEVTWDEALDDLAAKLTRIIEESGPDAVAIFQGGGSYMDSAAYAMVPSMRKALGTRSHYSDMSIDVMSKGVVGEMVAGLGIMPRADFGRTKMVIYVGTNPMISGGHTSMLNNPAQRIREFTEQGEVWVLDPRRTETAMKATRHLVPRAGTDYAVLAFLVRGVLEQGADWEYLDAHAQDVEKLREVVAPYTREHAAAISGVAADALDDFLAAVRRQGRLSIESGTGISLSPSANLTHWMSLALMIVTGSLDMEGGSWANPGFFLKLEQMGLPPAPEEGWRSPGPPSRPDLRTVAGEYVCAALPDEIESGNVRALINLSGHVLTCMPDADRFRSALEKLEVLMTVEILDNTMANFSTHALPAKDQLERVDVSLAVDPSFSAIAAQFSPAMVPARGQARSYWWILTELGRRMGMDFNPGVDPHTMSDEDVVARIAQSGRVPIDTSGEANYTLAQDRMFGWVLEHAGKMGGFRLAPQPLVDQLADLAPPSDLMLISRRLLKQHNSRKVPDKKEIPAIYVSLEDAAERGLSDGEMASLRGQHGEITGEVKIDPTLSRGVLNVPHGWEGQYNVNNLTSVHQLDPITGMAAASNLAVELTRLRNSQGAEALAVSR